MPAPLLSVVIPTYNGLHHVRRCMPPLLSAVEHAGIDTEIIVVDDASRDRTVSWLAERFPQIIRIVHAKNTGFATAANSGIRASSGQWVALLNNDVVVGRTWISAALCGQIPKRLGSIASQIRRFDESGTLGSAGDHYAACGVALPGRIGEKPRKEETAAGCFCACAAAGFYRRSALEEVGLLRESFGAYYEDVDLGFRLNLAGYSCRYVPASQCLHVDGGTYGRSWRVRYNSARNRELVFWGNMPGRLLWKHAPAHLLVMLMQMVWGLGNGQWFPRAAGTAAAMWRVPEILAMRRRARALRKVSPAELERCFCEESLRSILARRLRRRRPHPAPAQGPAGGP